MKHEFKASRTSEQDFMRYFTENGWTTQAVTDLGWIHRKSNLPGYVQVSGTGRWWHVIREKVVETGMGVESLQQRLRFLGHERPLLKLV